MNHLNQLLIQIRYNLIMKNNLYSGLADGIYEFKEEHIPQLIEFGVYEASNNNQVWAYAGYSDSQLATYFRHLFVQHLESQHRTREETDSDIILNWIAVKDEKLWAFYGHNDAKQRRRLFEEGHHSGLELPRMLQEVQKGMVEGLKIWEQKDKVMFGSWVLYSSKMKIPSSLKDMTSVKIYEYFWNLGYRKFMGRATSYGYIGRTKKIGVVVPVQKELEFNGFKFTLYFMLADLSIIYKGKEYKELAKPKL